MTAKNFQLLLIASAIAVAAQAQKAIHVYSTEIPWQSGIIEKETGKLYSINTAISTAAAGDSIIIHQGIYREKVTVNKNNLVLKNYQNDYVLVSGAEVVSTWTSSTGMASGVMEADISKFSIETPYTQLFANGKAQTMARYPNNTTGNMMEPMDANSGYALLSSPYKDAGTTANSYATFVGTPLPAVDLTGGIFRGLTGKMRNYVWGTITATSGNKVTFKATNSGVWKEADAIASSNHKYSWGFVMHKNLLDYPGEWFVENKKLFYLPEPGKSLSETRIEIQVRERVLVLNNTTGVTVKGINFVAGNVDMQSTNNAVIEGCSMRYLYPFWIPTSYGQNETEKKGFYLNNSSGNLFKDLYVAHSWANMFSLNGGSNNSFNNCIIKDFGWIGIFTSAIYVVKSDNLTINKCTFGDAGRFHVRVSGGDAKITILDSDFYGAMKMGEDAGPIECTSTGSLTALDLKGSVIAYNKIHDIKGIPVSDGNYSKQKVTAFYMEDTQNYTAHHNLVYNIKADNYKGTQTVDKSGEFLYMGPRYNPMYKPVNYYNNTIWNVDANISIWSIEIDNWKALGLTPPDTCGFMKDGHFANNIFMNGPAYKLSYVRQILTSTGGTVSNVKLTPSPSMETTNFNTYTTYCKKYDYNFNPQTNQSYDFTKASANFSNAANGDFTLLKSSTAAGSGTIITNITSSDTPDCGALEGGDRVLRAGSTLLAPDFKEQTTPATQNIKYKENNSGVSFKIYPNPTTDKLFFDNNKPLSEKCWISIYTLSGECMIVKEFTSNNYIDVSSLAQGVYLIKMQTEHKCSTQKLVIKR